MTNEVDSKRTHCSDNYKQPLLIISGNRKKFLISLWARRIVNLERTSNLEI